MALGTFSGKVQRTCSCFTFFRRYRSGVPGRPGNGTCAIGTVLYDVEKIAHQQGGELTGLIGTLCEHFIT
jgi:hypothetical protein